MLRSSGSAFPASLASFLLFLSLLVPISEAFAEIYRWTDDKGVVHFSDDPGSIPPSQRGREKIVVPDKSPSAGPEFVWFGPIVSPGESFLSDVRLRHGGKNIALRRIYIRRFMGRAARDTSVGMSEWWLDAMLDSDVDLDPRQFPRVFVSLVGRSGDPLPVYYELSGKVVKSPGTNPRNPRLLCWPAIGKAAASAYFFGGYISRETGTPDTGRELLDPGRLDSKALLCFLGCTPPDTPVAGIRVELGDPWTNEQLENIRQGRQP